MRLIFFNRSVSEEAVTSSDKCVFVGTDYEMAGHMQGEMIGNYLLENYDTNTVAPCAIAVVTCSDCVVWLLLLS